MHSIVISAANTLGKYLVKNKPQNNLVDLFDSKSGLSLTSPENFETLLKDCKIGKTNYLIWVASEFLQKALKDTSDEDIYRLTELHFFNMLRCIRYCIQQNNKINIVMVSSCSSWKLRKYETVYCALAAAKATFIRNLANEHDGKITLFNPGGLPVPGINSGKIETSSNQKFLDQDYLAKFIWEKIEAQQDKFKEFQVLRNKIAPQKPPNISVGPMISEVI